MPRSAALAALVTAVLYADVPAPVRAPASDARSETAAPVATPAPAAALAPVSSDRLDAAFARFRTLQGTWRGTSTAGWKDTATVRTIAGGTAVLFLSDFEAHPDTAMATVVHRDGGRLMLTHYCVAGNQPRLVATAVDEGARAVRFDFLDATNLRRPGDGHMHGAVFRFEDDGRYGSRWSFWKDGAESWREEIRMERVAGGS